MQLKNRALTPLQALGVILALGVLVGLVYGVYLATSHILHQWVVKASIPKCLDSLRADRELLSKAIEKYHAQFGFYPPNHSTNRTQRALVNPLYYELVGSRWNSNLQWFGIPTAKEVIKPDTMEQVFNMRSFTNTRAYPFWPTNFLSGLSLVGREEDDIAMVSYMLPEELNDVIEDFVISPWRYSADPAEHNKGKFDIWIEIDVLGRHFVIGNWPEAR